MSYVTGISGNAISAASAGWAPTNSAEVSAIASAYATGSEQVVSAVGTETAYTPDGVSDVVTSINGNYISALSADSAFQASYDENGRELTSLASEYEISSIASAYAESAVSAVSGDYYSTSNPSGFIDSAYVDSAVSGKVDSSALSSYVPYSSLEYNTASAISGINGSALAAGSTYSAGEGIDITDDVISVEAPVDIVAGPGIVIDNPDGNTLRVSQAYPTDETVLFEDTGSTGTLVANVVLSESSTHFSKLEITLGWAGGGGSPVPGRLIFTCIPDGTGYGFAGYIGRDASVHNVLGAISTSGTSLSLINCLDMYTSNNSSVSYQPFSAVLKVFKVVGVHRIANN